MPRIPLWLYIVIWVAILAILVVVGLAMGASVETVVVGIVTAAVVFGVCAVMTKKAGPRA
jgi:purine-cytosine permease-like protein